MEKEKKELLVDKIENIETIVLISGMILSFIFLR